MADAGPRSAAPSEHKSEEGLQEMLEYGDNIDPATFEQILEMDEDDASREFSRGIVFGFFEQAEATFEKMDDNLTKRDLAQLSSLGHFLKGSSATLGLTKVKDSCEKIQWYGMHKDDNGANDEPSDDVCLKRIKDALTEAKKDYQDVEKALKAYYDGLDA
ncbi:MAG: hypothetical protein M1838_004781 [Thelocarpon superellum]|nr:MAG: hypothetical protein M1838_004781 [Thelocarpon superellum]